VQLRSHIAPTQPKLEMIQLQPVLAQADCRADMLFFVRFVGAYVQAIYADAFSGQSKNAKARRNRLRQLVDDCKDLTSADLKQHLKTTALHGAGNVDFLSEGVRKFYESFPKRNADHLTLTDVFERCLQENHMIYGGFAHYQNHIHKPLIDLRHLLEHWQDKIKKHKPAEIAQMVQAGFAAMGLLLLPQVAHLLCGRLTYWQHKLSTTDDAYKVARSVAVLRDYFSSCHSYRREMNKYHFSLVRTRATMDKSRRKAAVSSSTAWAKAHTAWCYAHKDDYKLHEFKWRYYVLGRHNLLRIKAQLQHAGSDSQLSFKRDIEPFYLLSCRINLLPHQPAAASGHEPFAAR
jgi:hypothetical protein